MSELQGSADEFNAADPHLNLFRRYDAPWGSSEYENNITHALINTLRLSDPRATRLILTELVPQFAGIPVDWTQIAWGLQRPPNIAPDAFEHRIVLGISVDGCGQQDSSIETTESSGIPDGWIYTKGSNTLCVLIEIKTRGGIDLDQIKRHEISRFGTRGATLVKIDLLWKAVSRAFNRAYYEYPNPVIAEFLGFLSAERLAATLKFDDATVHFCREADGRLPPDFTAELADRVRQNLGLRAADMVMYAEWRPHVFIFTNFEAVGNVEIWRDARCRQCQDHAIAWYRDGSAGFQSPLIAKSD